MTTFGTVGGGVTPVTAAVEAADPETLQSLVNAALTNIDGETSTIASITLSGGGDGHPFMVVIESALSGGVTGGLAGTIGGALGTAVRCWLGSDPEALLVAKAAAGTPPPAGGIAAYQIQDEQVAGAAKGQRFMGMTIFTVSSVPLGVNAPFVEARITSTQALGAGETILAFSGLANSNQFDLPAAQTVRYIGASAIGAIVQASVTVGLTAAGDFTAEVVTDPLGTPSVVGTVTGHVAAGEFDNVSILGIVTLEPPAIQTTLLGIRITSAAGSVLSATLMVTPL